jgi:glycosyltransferase involved in cell wall biosynthesis
LEILVVDNGSRDESARLDSEFPEVQYLRLPKNFGLVKAWNIGIRTAKGDNVLLLPPNVIVQPNTVEMLANRLEADNSIGAVCPYVSTTWAMPDSSALKRLWSEGELPGAISLPETNGPQNVVFPKGAPVMVRRQFLAGMNYFDDRFGSFGAELEMYWRLHDAGKKVVVYPDIRVEVLPDERQEWSSAHAADVANGAATFLGKHQGFGASVGFKLGAAAASLGRALTFQKPGFHLAQAGHILLGQKLDGTQE